MPKEISKNPGAYNRPVIVRDAIVHYGKEGDVEISKEQETMLKEHYTEKGEEVPTEVKYKVEAKEVVAEEKLK